MLLGIPVTAVTKSVLRVEWAIVNSGFIRPHARVVIHLAPGDLPKQSSSLDLAVNLDVLAGSQYLEP